MPEIGCRMLLRGGYTVHRGAYLAAAAAVVRRRRARGAEYGILRGLPVVTGTGAAGGPVAAEDNKENVPPCAAGAHKLCRRRILGKRRSPLPAWFPRTPLRDITAIVNAMQRQRSRLRLAAQARHTNISRRADVSPSDQLNQKTIILEGTPFSEMLPPNTPEGRPTSPFRFAPDATPQSSNQVMAVSDSEPKVDGKLKFMQDLDSAAEDHQMQALYLNPQKRRTLMSMR